MEIYPIGTKIGQYEIASDPLKGGMGVVYFCIDHGNDDRPVALKTFLPNLLSDRSARERFLRESAVWVELDNHPHIVQCYEVKYLDPIAYLSLELIVKERNMPDASLRSWLTQNHPLPIEQALFFALQVAWGMQYATEKIPGFVHRDLKPENILVGVDKLPETNINRVCVTDFGLTKAVDDPKDENLKSINKLDSTQTQYTQWAGTPYYMSPEQWTGKSLGIYTDIYSFGCVLFEMLSGQQIVDGHTINELQVAHCKGKLRPIPSSLPRNLTLLLNQCLALEPSKRYSDWNQLIVELEKTCETITGQSISRITHKVGSSAREKIRTGWSNNAIGAAYLDMGKSQLALDYFQKAMDIGSLESTKELLGASMVNLGTTYANLGNPKMAIQYFEQYLVIARANSHHYGEGSVLGNLGLIYADLGDMQQAINYYSQSIEIATTIGDKHGAAMGINNLGIVYRRIGHIPQAIESFERCLQIHRELGNQRGFSATLDNLGSTYRDLGDINRSINYHEQALEISRGIGDRRAEGNVLGNIGAAYYEKGDWKASIKYSENSKIICREINNKLGESNMLGNLGLAYSALGDTEQAIEFLKSQLIIAREIKYRGGEGNALGGLGNAYMQLGKVQTAIEYYQQQLAVAQEIQDLRGEGIALGNLGSAHSDLGELLKARDAYQKSLEVAQKIGNLKGIATDSFNLATLYIEEHDTSNALKYAQDAMKAFSRLGSSEYVQRAQKLIDQIESGNVSDNPLDNALEAFIKSQTIQKMQVAVENYPFMTQDDFVQAITNLIEQHAPPEHKPEQVKKLGWLRQIARK